MKKIYDEEIVISLSNITDPRNDKGKRYKLEDIVLIIVYAFLSGHCESTEIEYYTELHFEYFHELIGLKTVPSHDTFSRIKRIINFDELYVHLSEWLQSRFSEISKKYNEYRILHVDGKAVRAANAKSEGERPIYILNSMYEGGTISLYTKRIDDKTNEAGVLPEYLRFFNLKNTIVTIDAAGCTENVINTIHERGGKFLLPVKENNPKLRNAILEKIEELKQNGKYKKLNSVERISKDHGRIEKTEAVLISDTSFIYEKLGTDKFYGHIARICVIEKEVTEKENGIEKTTTSQSILITDVTSLSVEQLLEIKLSHWNIESQHWLLDVVLQEDLQTERKGNSVSNSAVLRRFCLQLRSFEPEMEKKPLSRFLMRNEAYVEKIEELLFGKVISK